MATKTNDAPAPAPAPAPAYVAYDWGSKGKRVTKEFADAAAADAFVAAKVKAGKNPAVVTAAEAKAAAAKPAADPPAPKAPTVPGVRAGRTRTYLAGTVVRKHGLAAGVTPAMVAELDTLYGKPNPTESRWCLKNAYHACRAYAGVAEDAVA